jgi:hypothetical protein
MDEQASSTKPDVIFQRAEDFRSFYANSVLTDANAWDVKLIFGQIDEVDNERAIKQNVAVSMSFGLAKLTLYWIEAAIIAHEIETGRRVGIRDNVLPPPLTPLSPEQEKVPDLVKYQEAMKQLRDKFIASLR